MYQHLTIIGNLGRDPEMRYLPDGRPVTTMNIATNRTYKDSSGQQVKETTWFRVSVFGKTAENCAQYLAKGRMALIEGHLRPDPQTGGPKIWTRQDGTPGASFEMFATNVKFLPSGRADTAEPGAPMDDFEGAPETMGDEEIPF